MRMGREQKEESKRTASLCPSPSYGRRRIGALAGIAVAFVLAAALFGGTRLGAQRPGSAPSARSQGKPVVSPQASLAAPPSAARQAPAVSAPSVAPHAPDWPANDQPSDATVTWDSQGLRVVAVNSSLTQILKAIATQTGATLEGSNTDERIFGIYGPGPARDVICQLLDGSGYNVLLVGELGQGTPRQIILTARTAASSQPGKVNSQSAAEGQDTEAGQEAQQPEPPPQGSPAGSRGPVRQDPQDRREQQLLMQLKMMQQQLNPE